VTVSLISGRNHVAAGGLGEQVNSGRRRINTGRGVDQGRGHLCCGRAVRRVIIFQVDSKEYEIDLNCNHAAKLREAFAPYLAPPVEQVAALHHDARAQRRSAHVVAWVRRGRGLLITATR
jgi:hypothetical protein